MILRRFSLHIKEQNWFAVGLDVIVVIVGIFLGMQVTEWNEDRKLNEGEINLYKNALSDLSLELRHIETQIKWFKNYQDVNYQLYKESNGEVPYDSNPDLNVLIWANISRPLIKQNYVDKIGIMTNKTVQDLFRDYIWREELAMEAKHEFNDYKFTVVRPYFARQGIFDNKSAYNNQPYSFMSLDENGTILNTDKLRAQYGTIEFDQLLYGLRHSTSWYLHVLDGQLIANSKLTEALTAYVNKEYKKLEAIKPLNTYY